MDFKMDALEKRFGANPADSDLGGLGMKVSPSNPSSAHQQTPAAAAPIPSASGGSGVVMPDMGLGAPSPPPSSIAEATQGHNMPIHHNPAPAPPIVPQAAPPATSQPASSSMDGVFPRGGPTMGGPTNMPSVGPSMAGFDLGDMPPPSRPPPTVSSFAPPSAHAPPASMSAMSTVGVSSMGAGSSVATYQQSTSSHPVPSGTGGMMGFNSISMGATPGNPAGRGRGQPMGIGQAGAAARRAAAANRQGAGGAPNKPYDEFDEFFDGPAKNQTRQAKPTGLTPAAPRPMPTDPAGSSISSMMNSAMNMGAPQGGMGAHNFGTAAMNMGGMVASGYTAPNFPTGPAGGMIQHAPMAQYGGGSGFAGSAGGGWGGGSGGAYTSAVQEDMDAGARLSQRLSGQGAARRPAAKANTCTSLFATLAVIICVIAGVLYAGDIEEINFKLKSMGDPHIGALERAEAQQAHLVGHTVAELSVDGFSPVVEPPVAPPVQGESEASKTAKQDDAPADDAPADNAPTVDAPAEDAPLEPGEAKEEVPTETRKPEEEQGDQAAEAASGDASGAEQPLQAEEDSGKEWGEMPTTAETGPEHSAEKEEEAQETAGEAAVACGGEQPCGSPPSEPLAETTEADSSPTTPGPELVPQPEAASPTGFFFPQPAPKTPRAKKPTKPKPAVAAPMDKAPQKGPFDAKMPTGRSRATSAIESLFGTKRSTPSPAPSSKRGARSLLMDKRVEPLLPNIPRSHQSECEEGAMNKCED